MTHTPPTTPHAHLCLVLHNHQPVGNFDGVFEQAYQDSYLPFLEVFEPFEALQLSLHTSGPLMAWLAARHPEYLDRVRLLVDAGRIEIVGGPQTEPILTMLPSRDRIGQIRAYSAMLQRTTGTAPTAMWMPERVWESSLTSDIADAGIAATVLDDFHFKAAGWDESKLTGYYLTEDNGRTLKIFPGSETLRYMIPFRPVAELVDYCRDMAARHPGIVLTFGDDGEKFGTWPDTKAHVYGSGWLRDLFSQLTDNASWLHTVSLAEAARRTPPVGKIYLPDCSYREMTEWALPTDAGRRFDDVTHAMEDHARWRDLKSFVRGGYWRNFKIKYEETAEMYARMMDVSTRLHQTSGVDADGSKTADHPTLDLGTAAAVRDHLYHGQCNCPYWHGAFGGVYLPHLRNAIYQHLIRADNLMYRADVDAGASPAVSADADDYNFDGHAEVRLATPHHVLWAAPAAGGRLYEWDVRGIAHNLLATLARRPETYHQKVLDGPSQNEGEVASIHDLVVFKQDDLDQKLQYDGDTRKSLIDRFYDADADLESVRRSETRDHGDFSRGVYDAKIRRNDGRVQLQMRRSGSVAGSPVTVTKAVTVDDSAVVRVTYLIENLPVESRHHFGVELNFAGMPAGADDRYFSDVGGQSLGQLGTSLDLHESFGLSLADRWLGLDVDINFDRASGIWAYPVETVSQSEAGFEAVHQSVCVTPHWTIVPDSDGRWSMTMEIAARTESTSQTDPVDVATAAT